MNQPQLEMLMATRPHTLFPPKNTTNVGRKLQPKQDTLATQAGYTIVDGDVENITEGKIPQPIQNLIGDMVKNKVQSRTVTIKNPTAHKRFMKDVKPAIDSKMLMVKHNPINKDEMTISIGPKAQGMMFDESINELSLGTSKKIKELVKSFNNTRFGKFHKVTSGGDRIDFDFKATNFAKDGIQRELEKMFPKSHITFVKSGNEYKVGIFGKGVNEDTVTGGLSDKMSLEDIANKHKIDIDELMPEYRKGIRVEMEHTSDPKISAEIARDHLYEDPKYYTKLATIENESINEAKWDAKDSRVWKDKNPVIGYEFDRDSDSFWVNQKTKRGQLSFDTKDELIKWVKSNPKEWEWNESINEDDPCWKNYKQIGMKKKNGKEVPNCVPKESVNEEGTYKHPHQLRSNYPKSKMPDSFDIEFKDAVDADPFMKDRFFYINGYEVRRMTPAGPMKNPILKLKKTDKVDDVVKKLKQTWYKVKESVNEGKKPKRTNRWLELKNDETKPNKKLAMGLKELKYKLKEVESFIRWYNKISKMNELSSDSYWKRTNNHIYKIKERLINIARTIKELEQ
jgi:hypothetical protein